MKHAARIVSAIACVCFSFSALRIFTVQLFDLMAFASLLLIAAAMPSVIAAAARLSGDLLAFALIMCAAVALSGFQSTDPGSHIDRSFRLIAQLLLVWIFCRTVVIGRILKVSTFISLLIASCSICCAVILLQGEFNLLMEPSRTSTTRLTGLAEHPIEAGYVAAFGVLLSIDRIFRKGYRFVPILSLLICGYSLRYSVSITAIIGLTIGVAVLIVAYRRVWEGLLAVVVTSYWASSEAANNSLLFSRLSAALTAGSEYDTLASRLAQNEIALNLISDGSFILGRSFDISSLPLNQEIHNSLLAGLYHFGIVGLIALLILWRSALRPLLRPVDRSKFLAPLAAVTIVFLVVSLTGPSLSRRSLWFPVIMIGLFTHAATPRRQATTSTSSPDHRVKRVESAVTMNQRMEDSLF